MKSSPRQLRMKGLALLALLFLAGGAAGFAAGKTLTYRRPGTAGPIEERMRVQGIPEQFQRLGLSDTQRSQIETIITTHQPRVDSLLDHTLPRVRALLLDARQQMICVLTTEQRQQWLEWRSKQHLSSAESERWLARANAGQCGGGK